MRVARIYHASVVDGPGCRSVLQLQGCPIRCPGCYVPETHDPDGGVALSVDDVVTALLHPSGTPRDGVTVLGGEPLFQPQGLAALLRELKAAGIHTVVYSGYTLEALARRREPEVHEVLRLTDLLVDGPFVRSRATGAGEWRGSRNQRLIPNPAMALAADEGYARSGQP
ncbi:MAG: radical SAM protein [Chloroflexi bacterium]|nr:radical SAM protein [Chloroflexota bacterium]